MFILFSSNSYVAYKAHPFFLLHKNFMGSSAGIPKNSTMILFEGRASFTPNTLNNNIWTYGFAYFWQEQNNLEMNKGIPKEKQVYTY